MNEELRKALYDESGNLNMWALMLLVGIFDSELFKSQEDQDGR